MERPKIDINNSLPINSKVYIVTSKFKYLDTTCPTCCGKKYFFVHNIKGNEVKVRCTECYGSGMINSPKYKKVWIVTRLATLIRKNYQESINSRTKTVKKELNYTFSVAKGKKQYGYEYRGLFISMYEPERSYSNSSNNIICSTKQEALILKDKLNGKEEANFKKRKS